MNRMPLGPINPDRVPERMRACRHFLVQMADYDNVGDSENFVFSCRAFLPAFRTVANCLFVMTREKSERQALYERLRQHRDIGFLLKTTDVELHGNGSMIVQRFDIFTADMLGLAGELFERVEPGIIRDGFQFEERPQDIIELCHDALHAIEEAYREVLSGNPVDTAASPAS